ncbi:hypothetical protein GCAAIG_12930 [Candidatus Electronema halotolerans]
MKGKRYAILIAASKFPEEPGLTELRCPENDVDALHELLISPNCGLFDKKNTLVLKNAPSHEVLYKIETVLNDAGSEDLVLIYFSGHGKLNAAGRLCLATVNTKLRALGSTSIAAEQIKRFFDTASTRKRILILDCCYSGAAGAEFVKGGVDDQLQLMSGGQGTFIMTASTAFQTAVEKEGDSNGLFTKHLLEGIRSGEADRDDDDLISVDDLYEYVHEKVQAEGAQVPMKWGLQAKGKMIIAKSGRDAKWRQEMERSLHRFAADGLLTSRVVHEAIQVLRMPKKKLVGREQQRIVLIEQVICSRLGMADFMEQWMDLRCLDCAAAAAAQRSRTIGRYIDHGDGTITDTETGLMWKRCLEGLSGVNCEEGEVKRYKHDEAVKRFKNVEYAGYSDWRLPTIDELKTLVHCSKGKNKDGYCNEGSKTPTINQQAFPNAEAEYFVWSGSPYAPNSDYAWGVSFLSGDSYYGGRFSFLAVRLVRGGQ